MPWAGKTIWDTRVQAICGILTAADANGVEIYFSASFAQVTLHPPRIVINPNRTYAIEEIVRTTRRFAVNVLAVEQQKIAVRLMKMPRRQPAKAEILGLEICQDQHGIPFLKNSLRTVFCDIEAEIPGGDRKLYVARVIESRFNEGSYRDRPLLFAEVTTGESRFPRLRKQLRNVAIVTGMLDLVKSLALRYREPPSPDIARTTYEMAGATEPEIEKIKFYGLKNTGRFLNPPEAPAVIRKRLGICVVGTGWGSFHCNVIRKANPSARLFVCGRDSRKASRLARAVGAEGFFVDLEQAVTDPRVQALTLALPHDLHRKAAEVVAQAGKHALVEKPIATTLEDADAMIAAAEKAGTILMVAEDMHFRPAIRDVVRRISLGDIGEPLYLLVNAGGIRKPRGWAANKDRMGGGVMIDIGVHYVRGMRLLMGEPNQVFASRAMQIDTKIEGEDSVQVIFSSNLGWQSHMLFSWSTYRGDLPDILLEGSEGTFHLWPGKRFIDYYPASSRPLTRAISLVRPRSLRDKLLRPRLQRIRKTVRDSDPTGYRREFTEFMAAVSEDRSPVTPPHDGRRDLEVVLSAYEALMTCTVIAIPCLQTTEEHHSR